MDQDTMIKKINAVKNNPGISEVFYKLRPPEEFGDNVNLTYEKQNHLFKATVFDPETNTVFYEKKLATEDDTYLFISNVLDGKSVATSPTLEEATKETDYINIYWDEWK